MKRILYTASLLLFCTAISFAQQNMTMYNMAFLPQCNTLNPALQYFGTGVVGFPFLSSTGISMSNSAFKYSDLVKRSADDSLYLDPANMISKMKDENFINTSFTNELLTFGLKIKNSYFGLSATEKVNVQFTYPKEMIEFLWKGNGAMLGEEVVFNFGVNATHYREYALIYSTAIKKNFHLGMRLKYLYGMENVSTNNSQVSLYTDANSLAITAKSMINVNTSGIEENTFDDFNLNEYAFGRKNTGFATDFGFAYNIDKKINFTLSVLDLGKIRWTSHIANYKSKNENSEFTYYGVDLNEFLSDSSSANEIFQDLIDTLHSSFEIKTTQRAYETQLPPQIYFGTSYNLNQNNNVAFLLHSGKFAGKFHTDYSVSFNKAVGKWLNLALSYSVINKSFDNIGTGIVMKLGGFTYYFVSDNIYGTIYPTRSKNINARAGINYVFN